MRQFLIASTLVLLLASCRDGAQPGTGVAGLVLVGPSCPVERLTSPCPPRPLAATIVVRDSQGREIARAHSGTDGHFRLDLATGHYTLVGLPLGNGALPRPVPTTITVQSGRYVAATVTYDSGIR